MSKEELELFKNAASMLEASANKNVVGEVRVELKQESWGLMVYLSYGDKTDQFNTDGYNFNYNMKRLFNNEVVSAILE